MNPDIVYAGEGLAEIGIYIPEESANRQGQSVEAMLMANLHVANRAGNTVAHAICGSRDFLTLLPSNFLSENILMITNALGGSAAHYGALCGMLGYINPQLLSDDVVNQQDNFGGNLLHYAAEGQCLRDVPLRFLTPQNLFNLKDTSGKSPVSLTASHNLDHIPWRSFKAPKWLKFVGDLREISQPPFPRCEALTQFVEEVETFSQLKKKSELTSGEDVLGRGKPPRGR